MTLYEIYVIIKHTESVCKEKVLNIEVRIMDPTLRKAIYDKYIAPTQKQRPDYIGVEIEMPVVNLLTKGLRLPPQSSLQRISDFRSPDGARTAISPLRRTAQRGTFSRLTAAIPIWNCHSARHADCRRSRNALNGMSAS